MRVDETVWIEMADGVRLAARIWWPDGPGPHPAVLEFLPYRRRDGTTWRDESTYPAFAAAGIVGVRVDARGHGDSDGLFDDEYSLQELDDAHRVIEWIAAQPWSSGAVGMMGISWGGFNCLQLASWRPQPLQAVISLNGTADRFGDDIHYKGGALLAANFSWAGTMLSYASRPPDPEVVGPRWRKMWLERLAGNPFLIETWLRHARRDAYWRHGSVCEDWSAIQVLVWAIAGFGDGYRNAPGALATGLAGAVKATVGPWIHKYPHFAWPRPRADFTGMAMAWWRRWLCDEPTGVEDWPTMQAWLADGPRPGGVRTDETGEWVAVNAWPADEVAPVARTLGAGGVLGGAVAGPVQIATPQHCGVMAGEFFALAPDGDLPGDQRWDDALSVCWEGAPQTAPLELLGRAVVEADVALDQPQGNLIARLVDVWPDGTARLIARGVLNLSHRAGSEAPQPMVPGVPARVRLVLDECGHRLLPGHRLRLALSTAYWPLVLPGPAPVVATLTAGVLRLPVLTGGARQAPPLPADPDPLPRYAMLAPARAERQVETDLQTGRVRYRVFQDTGASVNPTHGMVAQETRAEVWEIAPDDPTSATATLVFTARRQRGDWQVATRAEIGLHCDASHWHLTGALSATEGEAEVFAKTWAVSVPRDHM